ncbi:MAG: hypothetical protein LBQ97_02295 [Fusobacteriaceae bacterium]|jgi:hypothetical protein|nr:hypothetical protein [Fusobacteriaceae bacterium]
MKKLAILLGTLVVAASAFAGGKEPAAPEVKTIVQETVVYRSAPTTGSITFRYQVMGPAAGYDDKGVGKYYRENGYSGDFGRLRIDGSVGLTDKLGFGFQVRTDGELGLDDKDPTIRDASRFRAWFTYKHDFLNATSRLWYGDTGAYYNGGVGGGTEIPGGDALEYRFMVPLAEYFFDNDFVKTAKFNVGPQVGYVWDHSGGSTATYYAGLALETTHTFPLGFSLDVNVYGHYVKTNIDSYYDLDKSNDFQAYIEVYLRNKVKLVDLSDSATLSFVFEGGFDPYAFSSKKIYTDKWGVDGTTAYSLYALPTLRVDWAATDSVSVFVEAGAEWRNGFAPSKTARGWTAAPYAQTGFTVKF